MAVVERSIDRGTVAFVALTALFVASLTASNFLASKLFYLNLAGLTLIAPAAVAAYALTFTFTDIISEVYGKRAASIAVRLGFLTQLLVLGYAMIALRLPAHPEISPVDDATFQRVIGSSGSIIAASLIAYLVSQHHDVWAFHFWKIKTGGRWLWLRNNASTAVSQLIDTALFITLAFSVFPALAGGNPAPLSVIPTIIASQYIIKLLIAVLDTPLVYLGVMLTTNYIGSVPRLSRSVDTTLDTTTTMTVR